MEFEPWNLFKLGEIIKPLNIEEPPCKYCAFWSPRALSDSDGEYIGVKLCTKDSMHHDFSCFKNAY